MSSQISNGTGAVDPPKAANANPTFRARNMAALYVSNLSENVKETELHGIFHKYGRPESVRLCRDAAGKSLGYGYVNYLSESQASEAMSSLNFTVHFGKEIRIMWSQPNQQIRKNGVGNLIIRNLPKTMTNIQLYHTFRKFGTIMSCRIMMDENNESRGYGYVHYTVEEDANKVIETVNGKTIEKCVIKVSKFVPKEKRKSVENHFNNVYVKNFKDGLDSESLANLFSKFGPITRAKVMNDDEGRSKGFGFVCFEKWESAEQAVEQMNKYMLEVKDTTAVNGEPKVLRYELFVGKAMKKADREAALKKQHAHSKGNGITLLVRYINEQVTQKQVQDYFSKIGKLSSVNLQMDSNAKTQNGFIVYENRENAIDAMEQLSGTTLGGSTIYIVVQKSDEINELTRQQQMMYGRPPYYQNGNVFTSGIPNMPPTFVVPPGNYRFPNPRPQYAMTRNDQAFRQGNGQVPSMVVNNANMSSMPYGMRGGMTNQPNQARISVQPNIHPYSVNNLNEQGRRPIDQIISRIMNEAGPINQEMMVKITNKCVGMKAEEFEDPKFYQELMNDIKK